MRLNFNVVFSECDGANTIKSYTHEYSLRVISIIKKGEYNDSGI